MKILFKIVFQWFNSLKEKSFLSLVLIFIVVIFLIILPIVASVLPFTYLAL